MLSPNLKCLFEDSFTKYGALLLNQIKNNNMKKNILLIGGLVLSLLFTACNSEKNTEVAEKVPTENVVEDNATEEVTIVKLEETPGEFSTKELKLAPGTYSFEVSNKNVDKEVAFVLAPSKENIVEADFIQDAMLTKMIKSGETATSKKPVTLEKGEYVYFCPLNGTPQYKLTVE